jgi:hypothetical protein
VPFAVGVPETSLLPHQSLSQSSILRKKTTAEINKEAKYLFAVDTFRGTSGLWRQSSYCRHMRSSRCCKVRIWACKRSRGLSICTPRRGMRYDQLKIFCALQASCDGTSNDGSLVYRNKEVVLPTGERHEETWLRQITDNELIEQRIEFLVLLAYYTLRT